MREINQDGFNLLTTYEGCKLTSYKDQGGVWTIGYGHTGLNVTDRMTITRDSANKMLLDDLQKFYHLDQYLTEQVNDNQYSALICLAFNVGLSALKTSQVLRLVNCEEDPTKEWMQWCHVNGVVNNGLINRRKAELELFFKVG